MLLIKQTHRFFYGSLYIHKHRKNRTWKTCKRRTHITCLCDRCYYETTARSLAWSWRRSEQHVVRNEHGPNGDVAASVRALRIPWRARKAASTGVWITCGKISLQPLQMRRGHGRGCSIWKMLYSHYWKVPQTIPITKQKRVGFFFSNITVLASMPKVANWTLACIDGWAVSCAWSNVPKSISICHQGAILNSTLKKEQMVCSKGRPFSSHRARRDQYIQDRFALHQRAFVESVKWKNT